MRSVVLTGIMNCLIKQSRDGLANLNVGLNQLKTHLNLDVRKQPLLQKNIQKVIDLIARDARYTVGNIARFVGISVGSVHTILKKILKVRRLTARWMPHLLTNEQKSQRVKTARELLKRYPKFDKNVFNSFVTGDETWVSSHNVKLSPPSNHPSLIFILY